MKKLLNDFDTLSELGDLPDNISRHFIQNGLCRQCNLAAREHRVLESSEVTYLTPAVNIDDSEEEYVICWTEKVPGEYEKHFCVRAADHPRRNSRKEFEDLYG